MGAYSHNYVTCFQSQYFVIYGRLKWVDFCQWKLTLRFIYVHIHKCKLVMLSLLRSPMPLSNTILLLILLLILWLIRSGAVRVPCLFHHATDEVVTSGPGFHLGLFPWGGSSEASLVPSPSFFACRKERFSWHLPSPKRGTSDRDGATLKLGFPKAHTTHIRGAQGKLSNLGGKLSTLGGNLPLRSPP